MRFYLVLYSFINCFFCNIFSLLLRPSQLAQKPIMGIHVKDCLFLLSPMQVFFVLWCINAPPHWNCGEEYDITRPCQGGSHVARLNFKTSHVGVCKCLSLIVGFAITVAIWPRKVVSCRDFILRTVATFWAMSLVGIYPGRASIITQTTGPRWIVLSTG